MEDIKPYSFAAWRRLLSYAAEQDRIVTERTLAVHAASAPYDAALSDRFAERDAFFGGLS